jgi:hypothetical protein
MKHFVIKVNCRFWNHLKLMCFKTIYKFWILFSIYWRFPFWASKPVSVLEDLEDIEKLVTGWTAKIDLPYQKINRDSQYKPKYGFLKRQWHEIFHSRF